MRTIYETPAELSTYLHFHYPAVADTFPAQFGLDAFTSFNARVLRRFLRAPADPAARALDLGCAVGGASFELSRCFGEVIGVDLSHAFIEAARRIGATGEHPVSMTTVGGHAEHGMARLPAGARPERVTFIEGDACTEPDGAEPFACVVALNLLCRLPEPRALLRRLPALVQPGGQLILSTPLSWNETFTPRAEWLDEEPLARLQAELAPHFVLEETDDLPFLLRETERKFHWSVPQCSSWRRV